MSRKDVKTHHRASVPSDGNGSSRTLCGIALDGLRAAPIAEPGQSATCGNCSKHRDAPVTNARKSESLPAAG